MTNIDVVILAGGKGTRMKDGIPKPMHKVAGITMLEHIVRAAKTIKPNKIIVVQTPDTDYSDYGDEQVVQTVQNGSAIALKTALPKVTAPKVLVLNADMPLISENLLAKTIKHQSALVVGDVLNPFGYGRVVKKDGRVSKIVEQKDATEVEQKITLVNSGVYLFDTKKVTEDLENISNENAQGEFYLTDAAVGLEIVVAEDLEDIQGANDQAQLAEVTKIMRKRINQTHMRNGVSMIDPDTTYIDVDVKIGSGTIIKPNTVIETNSEIGEKNEIGPSAHIRPETKTGVDVHIGNFVETKKAQIGSHTHIGHLSYIGDAEIGESVNIGAGTIFVNYDGKNKLVTKIGNRAFIGSNSKLVAPVTIADEAITAAGSTIDHDVKKHQLGIARARQENKDDFWDRMEHEDFGEK